MVLFSVLLGIALISVERKHVVLDVLHVCGEVLARVARMIIRLTPYGLFAIAATAAGTMTVDQFGRLQIYIVIYVLVTLLIALWVLPGLIAALTQIPMRTVFAASHNALLTAFAAGDLFIVLPGLIDACRRLVAERASADSEASRLPDVIVPRRSTSRTRPSSCHSASCCCRLVLGRRDSWSDYPRLAVTAFLVSFGSLNISVPFLLDLFRIPADTFQLFLASAVINAHFGALLAAMHTLAVGVLGACATAGLLHIRRRALVRYLAVTIALTAGLVVGARVVFAYAFESPYTKDQVLRQMHLLQQADDVVVHRSRPAQAPAVEGDVLDTIRARGRLRVGYLSNALPFAFFNQRGDLVGYDIELAHQLASELRVNLEFVPVTREQLADDLAAATATSSCQESRSRRTLPVAHCCPTRIWTRRWRSSSRFVARSVRNVGGHPLAAVAHHRGAGRAVLRGEASRTRPERDHSARRRRDDRVRVGVAGRRRHHPAGRARLGLDADYPAYSVVVPEPGPVKVPLTYPIARQDHRWRFREHVDRAEAEGRDAGALFRYWILGQDRGGRRPRWSIIRDVLHWVR